jgi:hypothetical protein
MRRNLVKLGWAAALLLSATLTPPAPGQDRQPPPPPRRDAAPAYRMEIYEGPNRTVRYFGGAPADRANLAGLERAENDWQYAQDLEALKRQYVNSERILEPQRRYVQEQLYGTSITFGSFNLLAGYGFGSGYGSGYAYPYAYPYAWAGYGYGNPGFSGYLGGSNVTTTRSLAFGMGDEGKMKDAMVAVIAHDAASPQYAAHAYRNYAAALHQAASSPALARDLDLGSAEQLGPPGAGRPAVILTLKDGERVEGAKMREDGDWYVLDQGGGREQRIRKSEVTRIDQARP